MHIWQGQYRGRVLLAFMAIFFQYQIWGMLSNVGESQRMTIQVQSINIGIALVHLIIVLALYYFNNLSIERIFVAIIIEFLLTGLIGWWTFTISFSHDTKSFQEIILEYKKYCLPLLPYTYLGLIMGFVDTWLLQHYGGAVEQAYYSIGYRFASISLIATHSVLKVLWKEVAESNEIGDNERVYRIYEKTNRALFFTGVLISGFLIPWAAEIIELFLGDAYEGGILVLSLMFLYPIHQSLGQLVGTMYFALELTKPAAIIGMIFMSLSIITVYFLIAPADAIIPGLGLASNGMAIKMVVMQIVSVNLSIWWLSKSQKWDYSFLYQIVGIFSFSIAGFFSKELVSFLFWSESLQIFQFVLTGVLYIFVSLIIIYLMPWLLNLTRVEIKRNVLSAKKLIK